MGPKDFTRQAHVVSQWDGTIKHFAYFHSRISPEILGTLSYTLRWSSEMLPWMYVCVNAFLFCVSSVAPKSWCNSLTFIKQTAQIYTSYARTGADLV